VRRAARGAAACALAAALALACPAAAPCAGASEDGLGILPVGLSDEDATSVTVARLASADTSLANTLVTFRGEAVGEAVASSTPGWSWVLLESGSPSTSAVSVLVESDALDLIKNYGSYQVRGTTLQVTGIYRVADESQDGELDVTAYTVSVVDEGGPVEHPVDESRLRLGVVATAVGLGLWALGAYLKRRSLL
jgi:hypothetical protein